MTTKASDEISYTNRIYNITEAAPQSLKYEDGEEEAMFLYSSLKDGDPLKATTLSIEYDDNDEKGEKIRRTTDVVTYESVSEGQSEILFKADKELNFKLLVKGPGTITVNGCFGERGLFSLEDDEEEEEEEEEKPEKEEGDE